MYIVYELFFDGYTLISNKVPLTNKLSKVKNYGYMNSTVRFIPKLRYIPYIGTIPLCPAINKIRWVSALFKLVQPHVVLCNNAIGHLNP